MQLKKQLKIDSYAVYHISSHATASNLFAFSTLNFDWFSTNGKF